MALHSMKCVNAWIEALLSPPLTLGPIRRMDYVFNNLTLVLKVIFKALVSITSAARSELSLCVCARGCVQTYVYETMH